MIALHEKDIPFNLFIFALQIVYFMVNQDTICAISTGSGAGAIAVIRVSGQNALKITSKIFSKDLEKVDSHTANFGIIRNERNEIVDEVLITVLKEGKSFTGENTTEIACHGSKFIQQQIIALLFKNGCRMAEPGEFTMRAFFNGKMDLSQAEAIADLIASNTAKSHQIAMNQMRGGYSSDIKGLKQELMDFASLIELELDFSEEDVEFASRTELKKLVDTLQLKLQRLVDSFEYGNAIKNGVNTVIAGRPNAGKSTLLNSLLNEERAIVSPIAGTTRDTIEEVSIIEGVEFRFIDTAGIREATDEIERMGVEKTLQEVDKSSVMMYVFDLSDISIEEASLDLEKLTRSNLKTLVVANKIDEVDFNSIADSQAWKNFIVKYQVITISAKQKEGIDSLKSALVSSFSEDFSEDDMIVVNARHHEAFSNAKLDIDKVEQGMDMQIPGDLLAMDIRSAIRNLSTITGEISSDDLLGNIFANFCIGK